ncbi:TonB-dependent receptor domain-containing protein [Luteibacter yeojuensis]|uniref:Ligand-gated channel protein n=1 Tax=Luteibacter yeojuensis TaxID=345309 RepID=A0A0F3KZA2_9GAMM|nr:TonB-dependent receptor [Luteibacter yeojuensis]KJV36590.1 ligand-gated channel protein [Luteibacter yeojuensis]
MKKTLLATALLSSIAVAHAADAPADLPSVVVTANRAPTPLDEVLAPVTVITREDIDRLQPLSVQDLLTGLPGVAMANTGGLGQQTSMFMRGTNSAHTLVLVDGVRVGTVGAGLPAYEQLPVDQIDHIEVVRGPRSTLYGSDAIGGVIQIFTRHGEAGQAPTPSISLTGGSNSYTAGQVGISGGTTHGWYNASLGGQYTAGINACRDGAGDVFKGCFTNEPDHDAYRTYNGALSGGYRWDNGTELTGSWLRSKGTIEYDGDYQNLTRRSQQVAGGKLSFDAMAGWRMSVSLGQNQDRADDYLNGSQKTWYDAAFTPHLGADKLRMGYLYSKRNQAAWQNDFTLAPGQTLSAGVDYQQEKLDSATDYLKTTRNNTGVFALYQGVFGPHEVQLSARHDHNSQFGNHTTGSAAYGFRFDNGMRITASYGTAFHAPNFNDEYYPYGVSVALKPEKSRTAEIGLSGTPGIWNWAVNAYQTKVDDLIAFSIDRPINVNEARIRGLEGQVGADVDGWHVRAYATLQQPLNRDSGPQEDNLLARRPRRTGRVDLDKDLGMFTLGGSVYAAGYSYDDAANTTRLGGYATADLRATWHIDAAWSVQGRVANLADKRYETAAYYNQLGRTYYVTLRFAPTM